MLGTRISQADLALGKLHQIVWHYLPAAKRVIHAGVSINRHARFHVFVKTLFGRRSQRHFKRAEDDFLADILFSGERVNQ